MRRIVIIFDNIGAANHAWTNAKGHLYGTVTLSRELLFSIILHGQYMKTVSSSLLVKIANQMIF